MLVVIRKEAGAFGQHFRVPGKGAPLVVQMVEA